MIAKLTDIDGVLYAVAKGVDELDNHECSEFIVATSIYMILTNMGYDDVSAAIASVTQAKVLSPVFSTLYFKNPDNLHKTITLYSATTEAIKLIEKGFSDATRRKAAKALAEASKDDGTPFTLDTIL